MKSEIKFNAAAWQTDSDGRLWLNLGVDKEYWLRAKQFVAERKDTDYLATIGQYRPKRSLNANNYCWELCTQLANVLRTSKDEVYVTMLKRYGQSQMVSVVTEGLDTLLKSVKYYDVRGESTLNGKSFTHVLCYVGSSQYDTYEMSVLIDGIVSECKESGIETMTPAEIALLVEEWKP